MKRRIVVAIVLVSGLVILAFGLPLGVVIDRQFENQALLRLERSAILAERDIPTGWRPGDSLTIDEPGHDTVFAVYDASAARVYGDGPTEGDDPVRVALADGVGEAEGHGSYVIAVPVTEGGSIIGVLRAEQRLAVTDRRIRAAWAAMGLLAFAVLGGSVLLARRLARRIAVPVEALHDRAVQLGTDGATVALPRSGMAEIDDVAVALEDAATRVADSVARERAFSAEVSHQLRTPITGLRLLIETERIAPRDDATKVLTDAETVVERLEATVEELLSLARNRPSDRTDLDLVEVLRDVEQRWRVAYDTAGRVLRVCTVDTDAMVRIVASRSATGHIVDVLVDNALRHGQGEVTVSCEAVAGGVAIRVTDCGALSGGDATRHGIGLPLASRLAQAEGGDLVCSSPSPTTFSVLLPAV